LPKGSDKEEDDDEEGQGEVDHNDAGHDADTGHDANANAMRMLEREREGRADFYKSKDSLINDNFISLFGSQFKLLAVVPHRFLSCCLCNLFAVPPLPSLVAPPSLSLRCASLVLVGCCIASSLVVPLSLLCRLVVELPPLFPHPDQTKASWRSSRASSRSPYSPPLHQPQWVWLIARKRGRGENKK
jgi:hypothetical protein